MKMLEMKRDSKSCKMNIERQDQVHAQLKRNLTSEIEKFRIGFLSAIL